MHHSQGAILTKEKAEELQAKWKKEGNLPCEHPTQNGLLPVSKTPS